MYFYALGLALQLLVILASSPPVAKQVNGPIPVNLRIEGANHTIFEGHIITHAHNVTTLSGGTHHCDGTNNGENAIPGATCTSALDDVAHKARFTFDGPFSSQFDDFFITRIGGTTQTSDRFWLLLVNFVSTQVGGCQQEVTQTDEVLWAFSTFNSTVLKLSGPTTAYKNHPITVTVTDGASGSPIAGAIVGEETTGADGTASVTFAYVGIHQLKAERQQSIRSNTLEVKVEEA